MSETTGIGWTDKTWNPWQGCTQVSPGCAHCYMFREKTRYGQDPRTVVRSSPKTFNAPLKWAEPSLVFTCSWSDFFHESADAWRADAWDIIRRTPHLTYQVLTKRPERISAHLPADWGGGYANVWLGVSVENQRMVERARILADIPATLRFISAEPLLSRVDLWKPIGADPGPTLLDRIHWLIVGGESGPDARPMDLDWARELRDQCADYGVAYFLKQLGGHPNARAHDLAVLDGKTHTEIPVAVRP